MRAIVYSPRQVGNPLLKAIPNTPLELGDKSMKPDFLIAENVGALFLSMRYNNLHPEYIHRRIENMGKMYELRILILHADVENPIDSVSNLSKLCIHRDFALVTVWSYEEAGSYLASLKRRSKTAQSSAPLAIQKKQGISHEEQLTDVLTRIPRVNKPDVLGLKARFGSFKNIVEHANEVESIEGWGPTKSNQFKRALVERFTGQNPV